MAERFSGNSSYPHRERMHGSSRRGLVAHESRIVQERQRAQAAAKKLELIEKFRQHPTINPNRLQLTPLPIDLGNRELAAYESKQEFQNSVLDNKVTILTGATGSGKSTQGIQFLIEAGFDHIYATVPRKIVADNLGQRLREELREHYGDAADAMIDIVHGDRSERSGKSVASIVTAQTLTRMMRDIKTKHKGENIVLFNDEIHELDIHTEMSTAISAKAINENPEWRLVLASATMDESFVQETYRELNDNKPVPIVKIPGRPHEIMTFERPDLTAMEAYVEYGGDVERMMTFTSGDKQLDHFIEQTTRLLESQEKGSSYNVEFRRLIGSLTRRARAGVFTDEVAEGSRLSIISSPAGMSGITNPGNKGVITDGVIKRKELDQYGVEGLRSRYASQAEITQMFGRAGRDVAGGFGVLVKPITVGDDLLRARGVEVENPEMEFKPFAERDAYPPAQIYNENLSRVALLAAGADEQLDDLHTWFLSKTSLTDIRKAERNLVHLGALDSEFKITEIGRAMDVFPLSPEISRGLVEATQPGRTILHMARCALIAAAIDGGGLQDFKKQGTHRWDELIRPTSRDDFIAQLDIMNVLIEQRNPEKLAAQYDLGPDKVEQITERAHKVLKILKIKPGDVVFRPTKHEEEELIRSDFTPGMINLIYEKSTRSRKAQQYVHLLGNEASTQRTISDRSVAGGEEHDYIAGFPRYYYTRNRQGEHEHQIIDRTLIVRPEVIARYVAKIPSLLNTEELRPRIDGGRVLEQGQLTFGSIPVGEPITKESYSIPEQSRQLLTERVLQRPGVAQQALREVADELEWFEATIPKAELDLLKKPDAPDLITHDSIKQLVYEKTATVRDAHIVDELLDAYIYSKNVSIQDYYDQEDLDVLRARSPKTKQIGTVIVDLFYDDGQPYITKLSATQKQAPLSDFYLDDGREVLIQIARSQKLGGTMRISARELLAEA